MAIRPEAAVKGRDDAAWRFERRHRARHEANKCGGTVVRLKPRRAK